MKQVLQDLASGETMLVEAPQPAIRAGQLLIRTRCSLVSTGTERMLVEFGRANLLDKARQQPDKVKMVLDKVKTDGLMPTIDAVRSKLDQPLPLGYCNVGVVESMGAATGDFEVGQRVVSNGPHASMVSVPVNLCARVPDSVADEQAVFAVAASIGLQGIRLAKPTLGECAVVIGAGLIGLLTIQLLRAQGCRVLAIDLDSSKLDLAESMGAEVCRVADGEDPVASGMSFSRGRGVDLVLITASTPSSQPVTDAAHMSRKRGRIVLVGVTGLELSRADFYEKELSFQVSCSYGPGRYDPDYEERGQDYPIAWVRWTEQRNFEAVLDLMASGALDISALISHRFELDDAPAAYQTLTEDRSALGILLNYPQQHSGAADDEVVLAARSIDASAPVVSFIGAGNYASRILIPAFKQGGASLHTLCTAGGVNSVIHGKKAGFSKASTNSDTTLADPAVNTIVIATRHDTHADLAGRALAAGKNVFVEKPLAINHEQLEGVEAALNNAADARLMVGFNRRFAPHIVKMKALLAPITAPASFIVTVNAGAIPADHWTQDPNVGGGRIIGEACHFIDLLRHLAGASIVSVQAQAMGASGAEAVVDDKVDIALKFANGSHGVIHYLANGAASFPKERVEVFTAGRVLQLDNFRKLRGYGWPGFSKMNLWRQDKGQNACAAAYIHAIEKGEPSPIAPDELFEVARATLTAAAQVHGDN